MTAGREMPIFSRSFDLLKWLMQATNHFPRAHRHDLCITPRAALGSEAEAASGTAGILPAHRPQAVYWLSKRTFQ